jgi:hypothetical protein
MLAALVWKHFPIARSMLPAVSFGNPCNEATIPFSVNMWIHFDICLQQVFDLVDTEYNKCRAGTWLLKMTNRKL